MRIENGGIPLNPEKGSTIEGGSRKKTGKRGSSGAVRDSVNISEEGRKLHAGRGEERPVDFDQTPSKLNEIHERIDSEFYDSEEALRTVAERVLDLFGL